MNYGNDRRSGLFEAADFCDDCARQAGFSEKHLTGDLRILARGRSNALATMAVELRRMALLDAS